MKKSLTLVTLFFVLTFFTTSCGSDDPLDEILDEIENGFENEGDENTDQLNGSYKIFLNGSIVAEKTTEEVGLVQNTDGTYYTTITLSDGNTFSILIAGFSKTTGEVVDIDGSYIVVTVSGIGLLKTDESNEMYFSEDGTIKRDSKEKISFEGNCKDLLGTELISFSGYVESKAFEKIQ